MSGIRGLTGRPLGILPAALDARLAIMGLQRPQPRKAQQSAPRTTTKPAPSARERAAKAMAAVRAVVRKLPPPARPPESRWHAACLRGEIQEHDPSSDGPPRRDGALRGDPEEFNAVNVARILARAGSDRHVCLNVTTGGGLVVEALEIARQIRAHRGGVTVRAKGRCSSAGLIVLAAGDHREATPGTVFGWHGTGFSNPAVPRDRHLHARELRRLAAAADRADGSYRKLIADRIHQAPETVESWMRRELRMDAKAALAANLIHRVVA